MHKKNPKICTGCRVSEAKIYLYHSTEIAKARPYSKEWQTDTSVQKQWSMDEICKFLLKMCLKFLLLKYLVLSSQKLAEIEEQERHPIHDHTRE